MKKILYKPQNGYVADIIPYSDGEKVYLYYLHDYRDIKNAGEGTPWYLLTTTDFVHFKEHGEAIARGNQDDQDLYIFTGSVIYANGLFHAFYTGHNPHFQGKKPVQVIMHATSQDGIHYQKVDGEKFFAPSQYSSDDWRDPFVFYDADAKMYKMLLAARHKTSKTRGGLTVQAISKDLKQWEVEKEFYAPDLYFTHECPDLFQIGEYYYLIFSEFSKDRLTRYRYSKSLEGPWIAPSNDSFDGRAFYAAKSVAFQGKRYLIGWIPTKTGETDNGPWEWGGTLVAHELFQKSDGTLGQRMISSIRSTFDDCVFKKEPMIWNEDMPSIIDLFVCEECLLSFDFTSDIDCGDVSVLLHYDEKKDQGYALEIRPYGVNFSKFPNEHWTYSNFVGVERHTPIDMRKKNHVEIMMLRDMIVAYVNDVALSTRIYDIKGQHLKLKCENKNLRIENLSIHKRK